MIVVPFVRFLQNVFCASHLPRQVEALPPEGAEEELPNVLKVQDVPERKCFFSERTWAQLRDALRPGALARSTVARKDLAPRSKRVQSREAGGHLPCCRDHRRRREPETKENSTLCCQGHVGVCCRFFGFKGQKVANFHEVTLLVPSNKNTRCLPLFLVRHA